MNAELHHKWNDNRDPSRGSNRQGHPISNEEVSQNKITLKQNKPR
jgi:hypothetical protein